MKIILVHGAPCSGKTTYAKQHMAPGDVIIDTDLLAQALGSPSSHEHPAYIQRLAMKLRDLATREASRGDYTAWVISASPKATSTIPHTSSVPIDPGMDVCLQRAAQSRPRWAAESIRDYYEKREIPRPSAFAQIEWLGFYYYGMDCSYDRRGL